MPELSEGEEPTRSGEPEMFAHPRATVS
jgi:hypothetical protein